MNPLPYFALDRRKRSDNRYRLYIRQNLKPPIVIPTDFFVKSPGDFKKGSPKDPVLRNLCNELMKKIESVESTLGGTANLRQCWEALNKKPDKSEFVKDWVILPNRYQLNKFNSKWKVSELNKENLLSYLQHLRKELKDTTVGAHIAELKRAGKKAMKFFPVPDELFDFKPKLKKSLPREPLNWIELMKLYKLPRNPALDMFLFECFTGIRYSDLNENLKFYPTYILLIQKKTGSIAAPSLNPLAKTILSRNCIRRIDGTVEFVPYKVAVQSINRRVKAIAKKYGIQKNLSTHIGRHSYSKLLSDLGIPENYRAMQLGHQPISNTQMYGRSSDYEFASQLVLKAFKRAIASSAETYDEWLMDVNPVFKDILSQAV